MQPEFDSWSPRGGRRDPNPTSCFLTCTCKSRHVNACTCIYINVIKLKSKERARFKLVKEQEKENARKKIILQEGEPTGNPTVRGRIKCISELNT